MCKRINHFILAGIAAVILLPSLSQAVTVEVGLASGEKCPRCWHVEELVPGRPGEPKVCRRCAREIGVG